MRLSLRARITFTCLASFVAGAVVFKFARPYLRDLWLSVTEQHRICTVDIGPPFLPAPGYCPGWAGSTQLIVCGIAVAGLALLFWLLRLTAGQVLRPVRTMAEAVRQLGPQNLGQRVNHQGPRDALLGLAEALDEMLDRVATGYEGQRRFASNASHELRTPLAVQRTLVEVALVTGEQDMTRLASQLLTVNERNERLIEGLLVLAESDRGLPGAQPVRLDTLVGEVLDRFAEQATKNEVAIRPGMIQRTVSGDPVLLERLVSNLVDNAIKYNEPGGTVDVVVAGSPALVVRNTGQRVPAETVPALFEPFRRLTSERTYQRDGAGLGLSIVRSVVAAHHGSVSAEAGQDGGLTVTVNLP